MPGIFDEGNMFAVLAPCTPQGETVLAGIHGITLQVNKKKTSRFDVYIGITEHFLLVAECEERKYLTQVYGIRVRDTRATVAEDAGVCFPFSEIGQCKIEKGIMGSVNCSVTMRDGCFLKLQMPKLAGLGGGMPHHAEYREAILARLRMLE